jgi:hypothetical protein
MSDVQEQRREFRVVVSGVDLPDDLVREIDEAIHAAVAEAVASLNLRTFDLEQDQREINLPGIGSAFGMTTGMVCTNRPEMPAE